MAELARGEDLGFVVLNRPNSVVKAFESGQLATASDVHSHEIPGGQYTNLLFQSRQLGLDGQFDAVKVAYAAANRLLGDIPKVTPSSKVVGDLAQFMVANKLREEDVDTEQWVGKLPDSVVDYLKGGLGTPPGGFPEPLRAHVLKARGVEALQGRPGLSMEPYDFDQAAKDLSEKFEGAAYHIDEKDVLSEALYPSVFADYMEHRLVYDDVGHLPTHVFLRPMALNDEVEFEDGHGRAEYVELRSISELDDKTCSRRVVFSVNGEAWQFRVTDEEAMTIASGGGAGSARKMRRKASSSSGDVGAPMPGVVVDVKVGTCTVARTLGGSETLSSRTPRHRPLALACLRLVVHAELAGARVLAHASSCSGEPAVRQLGLKRAAEVAEECI